MNNKQRRLFITDRDLEILKFLWRWKLASTAALTVRFFPDVRPFTAYDRLLQLEKKRYLQHVSFRYQGGGAWALDGNGFRFLAPYLPEMQSKGYRSENPLHDYYATAFHLGEWLKHRPAKGALCSEQELRRVEPDLLPSWVPSIQEHRPDGYTAVDRGQGAHLYAFECELSQKSRSRYDEILAFYDAAETIAGVFWLAGTPAIEAALRRALSSAIRGERHHFMQLPAFKQNGWRTPFTGGLYHGKSLADLFLDKAGTVLGQSRDGDGVSALLETYKRPIIPREMRAAPAAPASD